LLAILGNGDSRRGSDSAPAASHLDWSLQPHQANRANELAQSFAATVAVVVRPVGDLSKGLGHWASFACTHGRDRDFVSRHRQIAAPDAARTLARPDYHDSAACGEAEEDKGHKKHEKAHKGRGGR
jgi:hypothetical protein